MGNTAIQLSLILLTDIITASNFIALFVALILVFFLLGFILGFLMNSKRKKTKKRKPSIEPSIQQLTVDIPDQVYNERSPSYYTDYHKWPYSAENFIKKNKL